MRFDSLRFVSALATLAFAGQSSPTAAQPVPPEMFGALPDVHQAEISPDGATVAAIQHNRDGVVLLTFYDLEGATLPRAVRVDGGKARGLTWPNNDYALALVSDSVREGFSEGLQTVELWRWLSADKGGEKTQFLPTTGLLYWNLPERPGEILMGWASLFRVNLRTGDTRLVQRGHRNTADWVVDSSGVAQVRIDYDWLREERQFHRRGANGRFTLASKIPEPREAEVAVTAYGPADAPSLIYATLRDGDSVGLHVFDIDRAAVVRTAVGPAGFDVLGAMRDATTNAVVGAQFVEDMPRVVFIDPELKAAQAEVERSMLGAAPQITSWSRDRTKFMVRVHYRDHPDQFFLYDRPRRRLSMFAPSYGALDGKVFATRERYDYLATDKLKIPGYLTVPVGATRREMPLIVLPHGGPQGRDSQAFDWWAFFYAARGYLVYQPQFRGSHGFGKSFMEAGYGEWGRKMQDDITEGVANLVAAGLVDSRRVCIVGASYGGYAALAGATLTPDIYACAISVNGVSNIPSQIADTTHRGDYGEDMFDLRIGARVRDAEELKAVSPFYQAHRARAPIMLIHGKHDTVVDPGQSRMMRNALEAARKEVEYVELDDEDHWLSRGRTRTEMLARSIQFIDKHIGAGAAAAAAGGSD